VTDQLSLANTEKITTIILYALITPPALILKQ